MSEEFLAGNRVELLRNGPAAFPVMLDRIKRAERRVWLEMYWFDVDAVGQRFRDALVAAAERGVDVRLSYDAIGSIGTNTNFFEPLTSEGRVAVFNPLSFWPHRLGRLTRRDHRKLLIADETAFTGGVNLAEAWQPEDPSVEPWRDDSIMVEGAVVPVLARCFASAWSMAAGETLAIDMKPSRQGDAEVAVLLQGLSQRRRYLSRAFLERVRHSKQRVWISCAYFVPSRRMTRALKAAVRRGVDVRVIVPAISDVEIVRHASRAVWGGLLRVGARIYEWQPSILHSKTAVIDGIWSTVGSYNLDYQSLRSNLELNVSILDAAFAKDMERSFEADLQRSIEVDYHAFLFRSLGDRILERVAYWFRSWL